MKSTKQNQPFLHSLHPTVSLLHLLYMYLYAVVHVDQARI